MKKGFYEEIISTIKNIKNKIFWIMKSKPICIFAIQEITFLSPHLITPNWMRSLKKNKCLRNKKFKELHLIITSLSKSKGTEQGKLSIFSSSLFLMKFSVGNKKQTNQDKAASVGWQSSEQWQAEKWRFMQGNKRKVGRRNWWSVTRKRTGNRSMATSDLRCTYMNCSQWILGFFQQHKIIAKPVCQMKKDASCPDHTHKVPR